jgi:hypothetical protein
MNYKEYILEQSTAVRTTVQSDVKNVINSVCVDLDGVKQYSSNIKKWLSPVIDLSDFHVYPMNGITEGLNWWMANESRSIYMDAGDYQWVKESNSMYDDSIKYVSIPSSIDGNFKDIPVNTPVALDLAYVGSTKIRKIDICNNVEYVFYSLSKSFGIRNVRTGWYFTRTPDTRLESLIHNAKYYNYIAHNIAETIINNFSIDYIHKTLYNKQKNVCDQLNLIPSDSVWLATTTDPDYSKFRRQGNVARICLSGVFK